MKIALVAMSGIRVRDEELVRLGLTLPGFVERSEVIASLPSLGLLTLAGIPNAQNVTYEYIEVEDLHKLDNPQELFDGVDAVAISSFSAQIDEAYDLADIIREIRIPVILGGLHVTSVPHEAKKHADSVVIGEGELIWQELLNDLEKKSLKDFYDGNSREFDLTQPPMPAFELLDITKYNRLTIQTSRGCPHTCEFCASSILLTKKYKQKPQENILAEIDKICEIWKYPFIEFADDNTFINHKFWKELLPEITKRKIKWFTETDISVADDLELLSLMKKSGCAQVLIGFESPEIKSLKNIEIQNNWKLNQFSKFKKAIDTIQSYGISVNGCFVLGLDNQSTDIFQSVFDFVQETKLHEVQITILTPFPETPLYNRLKEEKRLINQTDWKSCTLFDINYRPQNMTVEELSKGFKELLLKIHSPEFTLERQKNFEVFLKKYRKNISTQKRLNN